MRWNKVGRGYRARVGNFHLRLWRDYLGWRLKVEGKWWTRFPDGDNIEVVQKCAEIYFEEKLLEAVSEIRPDPVETSER